MLNEQFRQALEELDISLLRKIWKQEMPHLPQSQSDDEALIIAHLTRTSAKSIRFRLRAYSHAWLTERGLPSQLPDHLKPKAERIYPIIVKTVGLAGPQTPIAKAIRQAMSEAVLDVGVENVELTNRAIAAARAKARRQLLGIK